MTTSGRAAWRIAVVALDLVTLVAVGTALWTTPASDPVLRWLLTTLVISCLDSATTTTFSASKRK